MSSAHRPTWDPAQGKDTRSNSRIYSSRDIAAHTRLKFRQPGQGTANEVARRDLKAELMLAERESAERKAKGQAGYVADKALLMLENQQQAAQSEADAQEANRRKVLAEVGTLDADDDDDEESEAGSEGETAARKDKGKGKAVESESTNGHTNGNDDDDNDDDDSDSDDDEDETAELLRELEKIKRERAEEKERQDRERMESEQTNREEEIAMGNPLLNLQAALGHATSPSPSLSSSASSSFGVKRRWDDDVIFKNQAQKDEQLKPEFVNDLLRTQYHRKFIKRFVA